MNAAAPNIPSALLAEIAEGSEPAFRKLYDVQHQSIYGFAFYLTKSTILAEEVTQEIFVKIWQHRTELQGITFFQAWLKTLIRNQAYTYLKKLSRERLMLKKIGTGADTGANTTENDTLDHEYQQLLQQAIQQLPFQQQKVYLLSREQGWKQEEIAKHLGISVFTVKNHMKAALRSIRIFLDGRLEVLIIIGLALFFPD